MSYLRHLLAHKWRMLFQGLPLWLALAHDLDKLWPDEFGPYSRAFTGGRQKFSRDDGFYQAWHRHQRRSKHHWQAWLVTDDNGAVVALEMPDLYRREMLADWRAAAGARHSGAYQWYKENKCRLILHPLTQDWIEHELGMRQTVFGILLNQ